MVEGESIIARAPNRRTHVSPILRICFQKGHEAQRFAEGPRRPFPLPNPGNGNERPYGFTSVRPLRPIPAFLFTERSHGVPGKE